MKTVSGTPSPSLWILPPSERSSTIEPGRLLLYAQRLHSDLRPAEIARRYGRTRAAVTMATKQLFAESQQNSELAAKLTALAAKLDKN